MRRGEQLNWIKNIVSAVHMTNPAVKTFLLTHTPLVGHELKASPKDVDVLKDFVNWVNNDKIGNTVEAVFCGHTHENHVFAIDPSTYPYRIDETNMDNPPETSINLIPFSWSTAYIETITACKKY